MLTTPTLTPLDAPAQAPDFAELRASEFARLDEGGHVYLDYTGSALHPDSLVAEHAAFLRRSLLGNPHSESPTSRASSELIARARARVLQFLDADPDEYVVCFTANASAAIHLVASAFPFGHATPCILSADNHNSANGVREYATRAGAPVHYLPLDAELRLDDAEERLREHSRSRGGAGLVVFPAQSNFSGVRHPLDLVHTARALGHSVLLDAAAFLPSSRLSLRRTPADFVACSFYKMFGYPTGLGALIARRDALAQLTRPWFAGGTVEYVSVAHRTHRMHPGAEGFEDGTANFLGIVAIEPGLDFMERTGMERIGAHVQTLTERLIAGLRSLVRRDGAPLVRVYGPHTMRDRGATVSFNLLDRSGAVVPYGEVEQHAREHRISVRGGCFCNPGAAEAAFGFDAVRTARCFAEAGRSNWSTRGLTACIRASGAATAVGAVRASLGVPSNEADVNRLLELLASLA